MIAYYNPKKMSPKQAKKWLRERCDHIDCERKATVMAWRGRVCDLCSGFESWAKIHPKNTHCPYCSKVLILAYKESS